MLHSFDADRQGNNFAQIVYTLNLTNVLEEKQPFQDV